MFIKRFCSRWASFTGMKGLVSWLEQNIYRERIDTTDIEKQVFASNKE